jgi:hypothetical protein
MEPYLYHYTRHPKSAVPVDPNFHLMLDKMQCMEAHLAERIDGRCSGLEKSVINIKQRHFISLEMARTEADVERVEMDRQLEGLKLEVGRINRFLECETMANNHTKLGIFSTTESALAPPPSSTIADGPDRHRVAHHHRDCESGSLNTHPHIPVNGTIQTNPPVLERLPELGPTASHATHVDSMHVSQGRLPKIQFPVFSGEDP